MTSGDAASSISDPVQLVSGTALSSVPTHPAPYAASSPSRRRRRIFTELRTRLFGERIHQLQEQTHRAPLMSYLLTTVQSIAVVLVLGHQEIPLLLSGDQGIVALMAGALAVLVATVVVADYAAIQTMRRIPVLLRHRATLALWEHGAYLAFVLAVEVVTFGVVLSVIDRDPQALLSSQPIVPANGPIYWAQIILRAALVAWTAVQVYITSLPLPLQWATLDHKSMSLLGGHAQAALERLELKQTDIASIFQAFAAVSRPPSRRRAWWNRWLVRRDQEYEAAETAHQQDVIRALEGLSRDHTAELAAERTALEQARRAAEQAEREAKAVMEQAHTEAMQVARAQIAEGFLHLIATGKVPEWLAELAPDAAAILPTLLAKGRRIASAFPGHSASHSATNADPMTRGSLDDLRAILSSMGLHEARKSAGIRRGIWVKSSDIERISGGAIKGEEATHLARRLGNGAKDGRAYIAELSTLIAELSERNKLHSSFVTWQNARRKRTDSAGDAGPNAGTMAA